MISDDNFNELLDELAIEPESEVNLLPEEPAVLAPQEYGKPDINELVAAFEKAMDLKMPRAQKQRQAAQSLIQRHSLDVCLRAVQAVSVVRSQPYSPQILSLEDLRDKWNNLVEFYRRKGVAQTPEMEARKAVEGWS